MRKPPFETSVRQEMRRPQSRERGRRRCQRVQRTVRSVRRSIPIDRSVRWEREGRGQSEFLGQPGYLQVREGRLTFYSLKQGRVDDGRGVAQPARYDRERETVDDDGRQYA